jgi:hypothetical protein
MSALPPIIVAGITPDNTLGALLFGGVIGAMYVIYPCDPYTTFAYLRSLYGITSMQVAAYYYREHRDGWLIRTAVSICLQK